MFTPKIARHFFWVIALFTAGSVVYAWWLGDRQMLTTALVGFVLLFPLAAFFGVLRFGDGEDTAPQPLPEPTDDQTYLEAALGHGLDTGDKFRQKAKELAQDNALARLDRKTINRVAQKIDRHSEAAKDFTRTSEVTLVRLQHDRTDVTKHGAHWLGGLPALGDTPWPRDAAGIPLHHLAQISLSDLPAEDLPETLPRTGTLSFFVQTVGKGFAASKVIYAPKRPDAVSAPPDDLPPLYAGPHWHKYIKGQTRDSAPKVFPRWPVEPLASPVADPESAAMANVYMASKFPNQNTTDLSAMRYIREVPAFAGPYYWDTVQRFANTLLMALAEDDSSDDFASFVDEVTGWAFEYDPWEGLTRTEVDLLEHYFRQVQPEGDTPARFAQYYQNRKCALPDLQIATDATFIAAASQNYTTYLALPDVVRDDIDAHWRLPATERRHQMFGIGSHQKEAVDLHAHDHLLLQLQADQLHQWHWGARKVLQFWISDAAMARGDWDQARLSLADY